MDHTLPGQTRSGRSYTQDPYALHGQPQLPQSRTVPLSQPLPGNTPSANVSGPVGETLIAIKTMLDSVAPSTPFEKNMFNCVNLLIAQMHEMKHEVERANTRAAHLTHALRDVELSTVKTEQYSRRDCVTVTGVAHTEGETTKDLGPKVASVLSKSGVTVKPDDLSAFHRNGGKTKQVKLRDGTLKSIPPSVTVKFKSINHKDDLIRNYKNFDAAKSKPAEVQVYHSLTPHYAGLRRGHPELLPDRCGCGGQSLEVGEISLTHIWLGSEVKV